MDYIRNFIKAELYNEYTYKYVYLQFRLYSRPVENLPHYNNNYYYLERVWRFENYSSLPLPFPPLQVI
jgi:hypothetical protein